MQMFIMVGIWFLTGYISSYFAKQRGRDPIAWFVIGMILGLIGLLILFLLPPIGKESEEKEAERIIQPIPKIEEEPLPSEWFYLDGGRNQQGPVSVDDLKNLWGSQKLEGSTYVWTETMENWQKIIEIPPLAKTLEK